MVLEKPLIIQSDMTVLLDTEHAEADEARIKLAAFAELSKRPGLMHTYRITPLTLWNAAAGGAAARDVVDTLQRYARYGLPFTVETEIKQLMGRYGKLKLISCQEGLQMEGDDDLLRELADRTAIKQLLDVRLESGRWRVQLHNRGALKRELTRLGYPVIDLAGYHDGEALQVQLRDISRTGVPFALRPYQSAAVEAFYREGAVQGGSGVIVLPCGSGKTIVGIAALAKSNSATLILTSNATSVKQWKRELLDRTTLEESMVGEYAGALKQVRPVTIATYQIMTHRPNRSAADYPHMKLFSERDWGLIIYDEVHLLPAPVFRMTADIQATRRLGLTATLIREDGCEEDVFSLIGPKQYELLWKGAEAQGYIASVSCAEIKVPLPPGAVQEYRTAGERAKQRRAAENPAKLEVVKRLLKRHSGKQTLIIGQYLEQLHELSRLLDIPLITGELPQREREALYERFKKGEVPVLAVSKVANFAVDLPDAAVAIQVSGSYGSRQEEAQRIGRLLRPKSGTNEAWFYTVVSEGTKEEQFARKRQLFMVEQGYRYESVQEFGSDFGGGEEAVTCT